jgi:hypothetical protein
MVWLHAFFFSLCSKILKVFWPSIVSFVAVFFTYVAYLFMYSIFFNCNLSSQIC